METFRKGGKGSATVSPVGRHVLRLAAVCALAAAGLALATAAPALEVSTTSATTTTAPTDTTETVTAPAVLGFTGHGWGHGLGLSQWGAYGYAKHGWTYDRILTHYYTGTTLGTTKVLIVRVLLAQERKAAITATAPWKVRDAGGTTVALDPGQLTLGPKLAIAGQPALQPPLTISSAQPLALDGKPYRGKLVVSAIGKQVQVVDVLGLEAYLKGVVPAEMPSRWPAEALEAQAVASRSYALANLAKNPDFDLYGDQRDQVYGGVALETPATSAAIDATRKQVVLYAGKIADTLYFSTSGGRTASALEATGTDVPYLVPVADPYDILSPYHDWGPVLLDAAKALKAMKVAGPVAQLETVTGPSGRVAKLTVVAQGGTEATLTGSQVRTALGLRSTWFEPAYFQLLPAAKTMTYGGAASLTGVVQGAGSVSLEARTAGTTTWTPAGDVAPAADGTFSTVVKPQASTQYRLAWGDARIGLARIGVAPRVTATLVPDGVQGTIKPAAEAAIVQLQAQAGTGWATLTSTSTDAAGAWSFSPALQPGTYRVRVAAGHGLAAGVSASLVVP
jgi:stage II sporulation protein D